MLLRSFLIIPILFFTTTFYLSANDSFFKTLQKQTSMSQSCTCDCHKRIYTHKECNICTHHGGKFYIANAQIHIETQEKEGINHD